MGNHSNVHHEDWLHSQLRLIIYPLYIACFPSFPSDLSHHSVTVTFLLNLANCKPEFAYPICSSQTSITSQTLLEMVKEMEGEVMFVARI